MHTEVLQARFIWPTLTKFGKCRIRKKKIPDFWLLLRNWNLWPQWACIHTWKKQAGFENQLLSLHIFYYFPFLTVLKSYTTFTLPASPRRHWDSCSLWNGCNAFFFPFLFPNGLSLFVKGVGETNGWFCFQAVLHSPKSAFFNDLTLAFSRMAPSTKLSIKGWPLKL